MPKKKLTLVKEEKEEPVKKEFVYKNITYTCPVRGKVTQRVKVMVVKTSTPDSKNIVMTGNPLINDFGVSDINDFEDTISLEDLNDRHRDEP